MSFDLLPEEIKNKILIQAKLLEKNELFGVIHEELIEKYNQKAIPCIINLNNRLYKYFCKNYKVNERGQIKLPKLPSGEQFMSRGFCKRVYDIDFDELEDYNPFYHIIV